ncbi:MAG TPA: M20/M25/M40 family metallo-hydrolase [Pyrinomonadaceae bacterium]
MASATAPAQSPATPIGLKTARSHREESVKAILLALFLVLAASFSIREQDPPAAVSASAAGQVFSAERALQHLSVIAEKPHPIGSLEHSVVKDYLMKQLSDAGLDPQVQTSIVPVPDSNKAAGPVRVTTLQNILARLRGTGGGKAVLLIAHYDSVLNSFGASDNGAAVAAMLETLRALKAGPPLKNDVVFLFTDGEEEGMLGANAFASENPWIKDVGLALNFDARGNSGPVIMFETSQNNGWVIDQFAHGSQYPVAHSLSYELYRLLPNNTDLTPLKKAGIAGLNFANIGGVDHYHTPLDNLQSVDPATMQHRGSYTLALARQFGNTDLDQTKQRNAIYFDLFGRMLVRYSSAWALPLTLLITALFLAVVVVGFRQQRLTVSGMVMGFVSLFVSLLVSSLAGWLLWKLIWLIRPGPSPAATQSRVLLLAFVALALAITFAIFTFVRTRASIESLAMGSLLWWFLLMVVTSILLPGATFVFHWPLLFSLLGVGWMLISRSSYRTNLSVFNLVVLALCALPGIILLAPVIYQIFVGLTLAWSFLVIALLVLLLGLLLPQLCLSETPFKWSVPGAFAVVAIVLLITGAIINASPAEKQSSRVVYALNTDTNKAIFAGDTSQADQRTAQLLTGATEKGMLADFTYARKSREYTLNPAPATQLPPPELSVIQDKSIDGVRTITLRLSSPRQAGMLAVYIDSNAQVLNASVNNKAVTDAANERWGLQIDGFPKEGVDLQMQVKTSEPLKLRLVDQSSGLPPVTAASSAQPSFPSTNPDLTLLMKSFSL